MPAAVRVERGSVNRIEAFRRLPVALLELRSKLPGPPADGVGREAMENAVALHPEFQLEFAFEYADQNRRALLEAVRGKPLWQARQVRFAGHGQAKFGPQQT